MTLQLQLLELKLAKSTETTPLLKFAFLNHVT